MHRAFTALAVSLLWLSLAAAQKGPDREEAHLLDAVRSVRSQVTEYIDGDSRGRTRQLDLVAYDSKWNEVERPV